MAEMESVAAQKARLRAQFRAIREDLGEAGRAAVSEAICRRAGALVREQGARTVSAFWPLPGEVDLRPLLRQLRASGVTIALPVTLSAPGEAPRLEHRAWTGPLVAGRFGVQEPPRDAPLVPSERVDLALVPALAVAMDGTRLGYGGGFYDAYLAETGALRLAVVASACVVPSLPAEPHDARLGGFLTEHETVRTDRQRNRDDAQT